MRAMRKMKAEQVVIGKIEGEAEGEKRDDVRTSYIPLKVGELWKPEVSANEELKLPSFAVFNLKL